jgi:hypothetical protein
VNGFPNFALFRSRIFLLFSLAAPLTLARGNTGVFTTPLAKLFLKSAIGAAYTPISVGPDGKLFVQNDGHMFVVGN